MDITPSSVHSNRSRSRSRTRNSTANSRSTSATRRPSLSGSRRSISSSSLNKLAVTPTPIEISSEKMVPSININLDNSLPLDFFKSELIGLIKALKISKWHKRQLTIYNVGVSRISGALTNSIYKIEYKDTVSSTPAPSLLLRVYGKNVDSLIDRDSELQTLIKLSSKKIGPKLLGIFTNGRFEQFLEGFVTMGKTELRNPVISQMVGRRMKDLHYKIDLDEHDRRLPRPEAWLQIEKWVSVFEKSVLPTMAEHTVTETVLMPWPKFKSLIFKYRDWLFAKYDTERLADNYRFCHNDTQYGNLLLKSSFDPQEVVQSSGDAVLSTSNKRDTDLAVIDFEYSGANFPAFDIADHFCEWMSDYHNEDKPYFIHSDNFPTQAEQLNYLKSYVEYDFHYPTSNLQTKANLKAEETAVSTLVEFEVKKLYNEVVFWRVTVHYFWLAWGLLQSGLSESDPVEALTAKSENKGVDGTYEFSTGMEALSVSQDTPPVDEEAISSADDDFDYLRYTQQKAALVAGDLISFGLLNISDVAPEYHNIIKFLDTTTYDV